MRFTYSTWDTFCRNLAENNIISVTARTLLNTVSDGKQLSRFINLKHDVESYPQRALDLARIEAKYGHKATYYVQDSLMIHNNLSLFNEIKNLGHEVSYHHEVIDVASGDIKDAIDIYKSRVDKFEKYGFNVTTVCQHGNPVSEFDNRDFFRSELVQKLFPFQADIMVDFMSKIGQKYIYISDAGMSFKEILDPCMPHSEVKEIGDTNYVLRLLISNPTDSFIISSHPHRYNKNYYIAILRKGLFKTIRFFAKPLLRIPLLREFVFKHSSITKYI